MEEIVKILVVDEDKEYRMALCHSLQEIPLLKTECTNAEKCTDAITIWQQQQFDCVFLSYQSPDRKWLKLLQHIRSRDSNVPVLVLILPGEEKKAAQLIKAGASEYIYKNQIYPENLRQILRAYLRLYKAETTAAAATAKLQATEERYRLVMEGCNDGLWEWHVHSGKVDCNDKFLEILGISRSGFNFTASAFKELIHPDDLPRLQDAITQHVRADTKFEVEFRIRHSSGEYRYCLARGKAIRNREGCVGGMLGVVIDLTERHHRSEALLGSRSLGLHRLKEANAIGILVANRSGNILEANQAFLDTIGYTQEDVISGKLHSADLTPPKYTLLDEQAWIELRTRGAFTPYEKEYICPDGSRVSVLIGGALQSESLEPESNSTHNGCRRNSQMNCATMIAFVIDLSERKRAEAEIVKLNRDLERRVGELQTLLDVIPIGVAIARDPQCQFIGVNPVLAKLLQLPPGGNASRSAPPEEMPTYKIYRNGTEVPVPELPMQYAAHCGIEILNQELDLVVGESKDTIKLLASATPLFDEGGNPRGSIGAFLDITERKRIEEQERFLADASALLSTSLDYQETLENLSQLIVPQLADWCMIHVLTHDQSLHLVTISHTDSTKTESAISLDNLYSQKPDSKYGIPQVITSGESEFYPSIPNSLLEASADNREYLEIINNLGFKSMICVPMKARGKTLGAISLVYGDSGCTYTQSDLTLFKDIARRAALAVENARLYKQATESSENLRHAIIILGEQQQKLRVLQQLTNLLNQRLTDLPGLLQVMVKAVCDAIDSAQFCLLLLHNPGTNQLELTASAGGSTENLPLEELVNSESGLLAEVFITGVSQLVQNQGLETSDKEDLGEISPKLPISNYPLPSCIYAVAIESPQAGCLGVLAIGNWDNPEAFDIEERNLLGSVGEQAAVAINNARMINALGESEQRLAMQNAMLEQQNSELELNRQQIQLQNLQLLEAARLKSQFLATMSHELRTPLNAILGFSQVLMRQRTSPLSPHQEEMVQRILNSGNTLLTLIDDILDLAKIEAGRMSLQLEEFNLTKLVMLTASDQHPKATEKHLDFQVEVNLNNPRVINDKARFKQVLVNLVSNAIKFTPTGSVEIKVWELATNRIALSVKDTGIGIAESEQRQIFEKFRQIDQSITRKHGGTGLGLALTKSLLEMMQGCISVVSRVGEGSTFQIEFPRHIRLPGMGTNGARPSKPSSRMLF
ncbi:MAG: PAS domain S-box protein [Nostocaceae cyanobacterium]|nr:PAS domain S-box protein [Nostocaceae cyanobacterium]